MRIVVCGPRPADLTRLVEGSAHRSTDVEGPAAERPRTVVIITPTGT